MSSHPYARFPSRNFWRPSVSERTPETWENVYRKRFEITPDCRISTAGSCFAQHIGPRLREASFRFQDFEPAPAQLPEAQRRAFGYGLFSARYGNVYTPRQLLQLVSEALGAWTPAERVWEQDGRYFDPFRPSIEPNGFGSAEELLALRCDQHLPAVRRMIKETDLFVFTLGLTEAWLSAEDGAVYPVCPGAGAGTFDPERHRFHNFTFGEIRQDLTHVIRRLRQKNPGIRFMFTVSPVPLTATATDQHVVAATAYSKSVLRAAAGELADAFEGVDYFPSYELIASAPAQGAFFEPDMRRVSRAGVDHVMRCFLSEHAPPSGADAPPLPPVAAPSRAEASALAGITAECDEEKLDPAAA